MPESRALIVQRVHAALDLPMELPEVEFKQDLPFEQLQLRIAKTAMGMANRRDGGLIIVGVSQDDDRRFVLDGMAKTNIDTYVQEKVYEFVSKYASPPVEVRVVEVEYDAKIFVAIAIAPFAGTPVVCKKPTPDGTKGKDQMNAGDFFVRLSDPVRTTRATSAEMLQELLQLAAGRRAAELIRMLREGGVQLEDLSIAHEVSGNGATAQGPQHSFGTGQVENAEPNHFDAEIEDINDIL